MDLLLATRNAHKTREFRELLGNNFNVTDLSAFPLIAVPEETGGTFQENAILKAVAVSQQLVRTSRCDVRTAQRAVPTLVLADDSGLDVDALGGAPGIFSARYAGANTSDKENISKLLGELSHRRDRTARFRCVLAIARDGKLSRTFEGVVEGAIVNLPRGSSGFGYDPVFAPNGFEQTFGELPPELKNQISHRGRAVRKLCVALEAGEAD
jgi:XTP/dITP diphosphohydrolase